MQRYRPITDWAEIPIVFDVPMAARILGKCTEIVKKMARSGDIPAHKIGSEWRFEKEEFREYLLTGIVPKYETRNCS